MVTGKHLSVTVKHFLVGITLSSPTCAVVTNSCTCFGYAIISVNVYNCMLVKQPAVFSGGLLALFAVPITIHL